MRALGISVISMAMTAAVIGNAYYQKKQFYPSVVYITKSNSSMAVIYIQSLVLVLMLGKLMRKIFLGTLRAAEFEHLMERFWYALTETCLAFTVFRDDFNPKFVALFTVLLFLKSFHWLAEDRVDYMERSPVIGWVFHLRVASLLAVLGFFDYMMIAHAYHSTITKGATVQLVFGFEYAILITMVANTTIKYVLHAAELRSDTPWDNKAVFLLYTELIIGLIRVILYVLFVIIMVRIYTLPLFAFRPMYYTTSHFKKALNDVILSRRAIRNMNTLYPDATPEELALSDNICIICREDMVSNSKKLPCGHIFHTACLRSWFQRQQTCPTCRLNILRTPIVATQQPQQQQQQPAQQQQPQVQQQQPLQGQQPGQGLLPQLPGQAVRNMINPGGENNNVGANLFINMLSPTNMATGVNGVAAATGMMGNVGGTGGTVNPFVMPQFPFMMPYAIPPPSMPPALDTLTDDEIRALEGNERKHVEERIKLLRNIQLLLDASVTLMHQYSAITARLPAMPVPTPVQLAGTSTGGNVSSATVTTMLSEHQQQQPSTSGINNLLKKNLAKEDIVKIEDIGREDDLDKPSKLNNDNTTIVTTLYPDIDNILPNINNNNNNNNNSNNNNTNSNNNINNNFNKNINNNCNNSKNNILNDSSCSSGTTTVASARASELSANAGTSSSSLLSGAAGVAGAANTTFNKSKEDELLQTNNNNTNTDDTNDNAAELRRRRLQKFVQYEKDMRD